MSSPAKRLRRRHGSPLSSLKVRGSGLDHPLRDDANKALRQRVIQHLKSGCSVKRAGDLIFVCGGNDPTHMRPRFTSYCSIHYPELELFQPEYAMKDYFAGPGGTPFDLGTFERLVAELSHVIVLFPEAAGSFAEAGYFAQDERFRSKTLLALDLQWQGSDSFISMGPARQFNQKSRFAGTMQIPYAAPDFEQIVQRLKRFGFERYRKELNLSAFSDLSPYDLFCLLHKVVDLIGIATIEDILYVLRGVFSGAVRPKRIKEMMSVLVGANYMQAVGGFGHYRIAASRPDLMQPRDSLKGVENQIRLDLAAFYPTCPADFQAILESPYAP